MKEKIKSRIVIFGVGNTGVKTIRVLFFKKLQLSRQTQSSDNVGLNIFFIFQVFAGSCPNNSKELNDANLNFIKTHPLMNDAVPPFFNHPVLIRTGLNMAFTSIAVDPQVLSLPPEDNITTYLQVSTPDGSKFDVIFVGTSRGQLLKAVNSLAPKSIASTRTVIIEEIEVRLFVFAAPKCE